MIVRRYMYSSVRVHAASAGLRRSRRVHEPTTLPTRSRPLSFREDTRQIFVSYFIQPVPQFHPTYETK
jgi:hypothetical protein